MCFSHHSRENHASLIFFALGGQKVTCVTTDRRRAGPPRLEHDPEKLALGLDPMGGSRFSEKIMLKQKSREG